METQAQPTLRPLRLGELLDRAIRLYRANFLTFIGIIAVVYVPLMVLQTAASALMSSSMLSSRFSTPEEIFSNYGYWIAIFSSIILALAQFILVQGIATGALTRAVADNYLGKKTGILDAYRGIGGSWLTLIGALLLLGIIIILLLIWFLVPCIGWLTGLGMIAFVTAAVNPLVPPAVVLEKQGIVDALRRAWSLARRRFWPLLGYVFVLYLFSMIVVNGPSTIVNLLLIQVLQSFDDPTLQLVLTSVIQGLVQLVFLLIYYPLQLTAFTLIYFDLRVRTEGFDIAVLTMETSGSTDLTEATTVPAPQVNEPLVTGAELGNFAILTLAGVGLYIFFASFLAAIMLFFTSLAN
ncbi:MAG TPA: glycerophosphoryl diester phosphodiesterase membrane domain-containing protein [Anaerolineales bacterium]|nr:glycerophosphoryl diester phosphodiesterase membrane domain-containing protein [Anaerolineales bacterium]